MVAAPTLTQVRIVFSGDLGAIHALDCARSSSRACANPILARISAARSAEVLSDSAEDAAQLWAALAEVGALLPEGVDMAVDTTSAGGIWTLNTESIPFAAGCSAALLLSGLVFAYWRQWRRFAFSLLVSAAVVAAVWSAIAETADGTNYWLYFVLVAPVVEERLFRGFLLPLLIEHGMAVWASAVLSALLFALWHHFPGSEAFSWSAVTSRTVMGLVFAIPVLRFRVLWPSTWLHGGWNLFVCLQTSP